MFQKKRFFENKKIRVRFLIGDFPAKPAKPAKQKKQVALDKSLRLHTRGGPVAAAELVYYFFFFSSIPDQAHWPTLAPIVAENRR